MNLEIRNLEFHTEQASTMTCGAETKRLHRIRNPMQFMKPTCISGADSPRLLAVNTGVAGNSEETRGGDEEASMAMTRVCKVVRVGVKR